MITIVYASRAAHEMSDPDLSTLLTAARRRNASLDVTGMLLYSQQSFLQQIEGEFAAVEAIFESILADERHTDLRLLSRRPISDRRFPGWTMGFEHPDGTSLRDRLPGYQPPGDAPLVSSELVQGTEVAEALLGVYALGAWE